MIYNVEFSDKPQVRQIVAENESAVVMLARATQTSRMSISEIARFPATKTVIFKCAMFFPTSGAYNTEGPEFKAKVWPV